MSINDEGSDFGIEKAGVAEKQAFESYEKPIVDYESSATRFEIEAFGALERLVNAIDLVPEYAAKSQELLVNAREDIGRETKELMRQLRKALDMSQIDHRQNRNAPPLEMGLDEVVKPRAGDGIRNALEYNAGKGKNYGFAEQGYMLDAVKENYIKAQDAYMNGDKARGDMLMKNTEGMAWVIIDILQMHFDQSIGWEWKRKRPEDIFEIVKIEMQQDAQRNPSENFSKN